MRTSVPQGEAKRRQRLAWRLDAVAVRLARGRPGIDVALGEIFLRMAESGHLEELNFSKKTDFANEALGMPPRTFFSLCELASGLRERPDLKQAVLAGEVSPEKARVAMRSGERPLVQTLRYRMTADQQDRLDYGLSLAKEMVGFDAPRWKLTEAIAREWTSKGPAPSGPSLQEDPAWLSEMTKQSDEVSRQLHAVFEAGEIVSKACCGVPEENALGLLARAKHLLSRREKFDEPLGRVLVQISALRLWWWLGFGSFGEYCRERLGISVSTARQRIRLSRRMKKLPALRMALISGRISYSKALLISQHATPEDVEQRIAEAESTTHQKVKERADQEERQAERDREEREDRGPSQAMEVIADAVASAKRQISALVGEPISEGEALARIADHFVSVHEERLGRSGWRNAWQKEVLMRHGGLCAVPGCTRAARDLHHITFRSRGGPDVGWNCVAVCWFHHKWCIHRDTLTVRGRGGELLVWKLVDATLTPWAEFETTGDDLVRVVEVGLPMAVA